MLGKGAYAYFNNEDNYSNYANLVITENCIQYRVE